MSDEEIIIEYRNVEKKLLAAQKVLTKMRPLDSVTADLLQNVINSVISKIDEEMNAGLPVGCPHCGFTAAGIRGLEVHTKMRHLNLNL